MTGSVLLSIRNVTKSFGGFLALNDVSLALRETSVHALIGPNGAGKSTLLNVISGQFRPTTGQVLYQGQSITGRPPHETARLGLVRSFQITSVFTSFSVFQNVQVALLSQRGLCTRMFRRASPNMREEAHELLHLVRLDDQAHRLAGELAAGDRKRLEFAIAMAAAPRAMLLDEPTAGMSQDERITVANIIRSLNQTRGVAVLFTEHDIDMVFSIADHVSVLHQGTCIFDGAPEAARANQRVQEVYLGEGVDAPLH